jgi:hypothetical protein
MADKTLTLDKIAARKTRNFTEILDPPNVREP